jgi:hypothetical protein
MTIAGRVAFWRELHPRLDKLANRIGGGLVKILDAVHARIPMVTIDEIRDLQRQNAEADIKFWTDHKDYQAALAEDFKDISGEYQRKGADAETGAKDAAGHITAARDRLDRLAKGEALTGGLGKPMTLEDTIKILKEAGWTASDMKHATNMAEACGILGDGLIERLSHGAIKASDRWTRATVRRILRQARR